ncbi:hypothetical protein HYW53_00710 [Candidatus Giovannonibacteria bacterium]|nr:hypothetical protein [Candidatus Giovannonibacteria bacterium]
MSRLSQSARTIEATGLFLGMLIGAGMFALPYTFLKGGFIWSSSLFILVLGLSLLLHRLYAAVIYITPGKHRFGGYAKIYLGDRAEKIAFLFTFISFEGVMLAYGVLAGEFLEALTGMPALLSGSVFMLLGGFLFFLSLDSVAKIDFYLSLFLFLFVIFLTFKLLPFFDSSNLFAYVQPDYFLPYGIFLFAFGAYSALPDVHDVLGGESSKSYKKIISLGLCFGALFYLIFSLSILGALGASVSKNAFKGLENILGKGTIAMGSLIGLLVILRTYIALGADLKLAFKYDYRVPPIPAWLFTFLPSFLLFILGFSNLIEILHFVGAVGLGIFGVFIILMAWSERKKVSEFLGFKLRLWWIFPLAALILIGAFREVITLF